MPVQCTCLKCGSTFYRKPSAVGAYCSLSCASIGRPKSTPTPAELLPDGVTARLPLTARNNVVRAYAIIDAIDAAWASQWSWRLNPGGYAVRFGLVGAYYRNIYLHRELLGLAFGNTDEGDHIDRNRLNCRRENLRRVPHLGNMQNTGGHRGTSSQHRGVSWDKRRGKWVAQAKVGGRRYCASFANESEAAEAAQAMRLHLMPYATR